jgi:hypothetical protein
MTTDVTRSVDEYVDSLDDDLATDSRVLIALMRRVSDHEPQIWNVGTIGFDTYHYRYDSGREGDGHVLGFYPRKGRITIYLMDGTKRHAALLAKVGRHTTTGYCVYVKNLSDIDPAILEQLMTESYDYVKARDGNIRGVLWKEAS